MKAVLLKKKNNTKKLCRFYCVGASFIDEETRNLETPTRATRIQAPGKMSGFPERDQSEFPGTPHCRRTCAFYLATARSSCDSEVRGVSDERRRVADPEASRPMSQAAPRTNKAVSARGERVLWKR